MANRVVSGVRLSVAALVALLLGACSMVSSAPMVAAGNACLHEVAPTPTPADATATPTPTPTPAATPTPVGYVSPTPTPAGDPGPLVVLQRLEMPDAVAQWSDAIVPVGVPRESGGTRFQTGLVVAEDGGVLTVFRTPPGDGLTVSVDGEMLPAEVEAFDPLTGAALLRIEASALTVAPLEPGNVSNIGERVAVLWHGGSGKPGLSTEGMTAVPDQLSPEHLFALKGHHSADSPGMGAVVLGLDGQPIGLAGSSVRWFGQSIAFGGPLVRQSTHAAVLLESALGLLDGERPNADSIPGAVAHFTQASGSTADNPGTRATVAAPVADELSHLGEPADVDGLGGRPQYGSGRLPGTVLEMLFHEPQELRNENGDLLGSARYIALWWDRGDGIGDVVLCGKDEEHIGAAFQTSGLDRFDDLMDELPGTFRSIAAPGEAFLIGASAGLLVEAFHQDRAQADLRFRWETVETWGDVMSVSVDGTATSLLLDGGEQGGVWCSYRTGETPAVHVGERVAVRGVVLGRATSGDVRLDDCELAETPTGRLLEDEPRAVLGPGRETSLTVARGMTGTISGLPEGATARIWVDRVPHREGECLSTHGPQRDDCFYPDGLTFVSPMPRITPSDTVRELTVTNGRWAMEDSSLAGTRFLVGIETDADVRASGGYSVAIYDAKYPTVVEGVDFTFSPRGQDNGEPTATPQPVMVPTPTPLPR